MNTTISRPPSSRSLPGLSLKKFFARTLEVRNSRLAQGAVVFATLVPIAFVGFYGYRSAYGEMTDTVLERRQNISHLAATVLGEKLDRIIDVGISLSSRVRFQQLVANGKWNEAIAIMEDVPPMLPYIERLFVADTEGVLRADTPVLEGVRGKNFAHRDWYQGVRQTGRPHVSEIYKRSAPPQVNVVGVALPITVRPQGMVGILVLQVRLDAFSQWFDDAPAGPNSFIYIVDRNGHAALHPDFKLETETADLSRVPAVQRALDGQRGVEITTVDGEERIAAYTPVPRHGWGVVLEQPTRIAFAARDAQLLRFVIVYGVMLLLSVFAAYLFLRAREQARGKADLELLVTERTGELQTANKELQAFSYSVSHDLRAPLRSIDGFSRLLLDDCAGTLDARHTGYLQRIRAATQRMGDLIDDLLKLSRVTRAEMNPSAVDLSTVAEAIVQELRTARPDRTVTVEIQPGLTAVGDAPLLRVMLENLLDNAWKFTGKTADARIEFAMTQDGPGQPVYCVRDNGAGFEMAYVDKLFDAFQRLHGMDEFPGTGVGLATVQRVVRRHGGRIWAEAEVGRGATFYFVLGPHPGAE